MRYPELHDDAIDLMHTGPVFDVCEERVRQDRKWGEQNHVFPIWLAILQEEIGEASQAWLKATYEAETFSEARAHRTNLREELVQSAAVMVAMIECGDRNRWFVEEEDD